MWRNISRVLCRKGLVRFNFALTGCRYIGLGFIACNLNNLCTDILPYTLRSTKGYGCFDRPCNCLVASVSVIESLYGRTYPGGSWQKMDPDARIVWVFVTGARFDILILSMMGTLPQYPAAQLVQTHTRTQMPSRNSALIPNTLRWSLQCYNNNTIHDNWPPLSIGPHLLL